MRQYKELMQRILIDGIDKGDRTGTGTRSVFGHQMRFDLQSGFPLVTTKRVFWRGVVEELLWLLSGSTNVKPLQEKGVTIWDEWADENGELGPVYGKQWRSWTVSDHPATADTLDQISQVIEQLKTNPESRRMIVTAWNPAEVEQMRLPPCHMMFQFYTRPVLDPEDGSVLFRYVDLQLYQRSADVFLGVPFNIASYALLLTLIAREAGMEPGEFVWTGGDTHLYSNHLEQARLQLQREERSLPTVRIRDGAPGIFEIQGSDIELIGYDPHPAIKAEVSV